MSLFEQFDEEDKYRGPTSFTAEYAAEPATFAPFGTADLTAAAGYTEGSTDQDEPLFQRKRIYVAIPQEATIEYFVASSNVLVFALSNNHILRTKAEDPTAVEDIDLSKADKTSIKIQKIVRLFLDSTATHLLILVLTPENQHETIYLDMRLGAGRQVLLKKFKGLEITAVGWKMARSPYEESPVHELLVGTSQGLVFEAEIDKTDKYFKQIFRAETRKLEPITGLRVERLPPRTRDPPDGRRYYVMLTTTSHSFQYLGVVETADQPPTFIDFFTKANRLMFREVPGDSPYSELVFYPVALPPTSFAWLTGAGVFCGAIDLGKGDGRLTTQERMIPAEASGGGPPIATALTDFHVVLLFPGMVQIVCMLNDRTVMTQNFAKQVGAMKGLAIDPIMDGIYSYSAKYIFKFESANETRDVWQLYLERGMFEEASKYAQNNPAHLDKIYSAEADMLYDAGDVIRAAAQLARTQRSLEEVCLRFIKDHQTGALREYLKKRLGMLSGQVHQMQATMIVSWLVEVFLNSMNALMDEGKAQQHAELQKEFRDFLSLREVRRSIDKRTAYDLIASHGNEEDLVFFAELVEDYERVIQFYLQRGKTHEAVDVLRRQPQVELFYKFTPVLMRDCDVETIDACMQRTDIAPRQLIPAFIRYQQSRHVGEQDNQAIRYLEWCISTMENTDAAIHNFLLSLYVKLESDSRLLRFLEKHQAMPFYDPKYALRLCMQEGKLRACVQIYSTMGLYEEAVDLALKVDLDLARLHADTPELDGELSKKLWLRIARHVIEKEKDVKKAIGVLQKCKLLKIEDILPFFSDFVIIDDFQADIVKSLEEYNRDIEALHHKMEAATASAAAIRTDISDLKNKFGVVSGNGMCGLCGFPLLTRAFYLFPCNHAFHSDCLSKEVLPYLPVGNRKKVDRLAAKMREAQENSNAAAVAQLKSDLDEIFTEDCVACGDMLVRTIDEPFVHPDKMEEYMRSWRTHGTAPPGL